MDTRMRTIVVIRAVAATLAGAAATFAIAPWLGLAAGLLAGWSTFAVVLTTWIVIVVWPMDAATTRHHAVAEDPGRPAARLVALIGSAASLGAVVVVLAQTGDRPGTETFVMAFVAVVSVVSSWALIQIDYSLRVARIYYAEPVGGIDFHDSREARYSDFLYFGLGVGMGYQVADTNVGDGQIRRLVIPQALIAYMFGAVIVGTVVNLVIDLGGGG